MKKRLFIKIFAGYLIIVLLVVSVMGYLTASNLKSDLTERIEGEMAALGRVISLMSTAEIGKNAFSLAKASHTRITLVDATGRVVSDTEHDPADLDNHYDRPEIQEARSRGQGSAIRYSQTLRMDMIYFARALRDGEEIRGYIRLAKPLVELQSSAARLYRMIFQTILIVLIPSMLIALVFFFRIVTPIREIEEYTRKVREDDKGAMLRIDSDNELGSLARNINRMVQFQQEKIDQIREEKGKVEATFDSMLEGVMILNSHNIIEACNKSMMKIAGPVFKDIIGQTPIAVLRSASLQDALDEFLRTGGPVTKEISIGVDNQVILEVGISAIRGLPGGERKTIMVFHDVTRIRKLERIRSDFVANVSHEIKTPLTAIIGFVETLQSGALHDSGRAEEFLNIIAEHAGRLNRLVDDLLTLSGIELGEVELHLEPIHIPDAVRKALALVEAKAKEKGLVIHDDLPDDLPSILADRDSVVQILTNVLDNAVKFTPTGSITLSASVDKAGYAAIAVADTGIGIPRQDISRLGERFFRADRMRSRELGGTGLGLSIVKHLLQAQHGRMELESTPGKGTIVKLFFPLAASESRQNPP